MRGVPPWLFARNYKSVPAGFILLHLLSLLTIFLQVMAILLAEKSILGTALLFWVASVLMAAGLSWCLARLLLSLDTRKDRTRRICRFQHWGMDETILDGPSIWSTLFFAAWFAFSALAAYGLALPVIDDLIGDMGQPVLLSTWLLTLLLAILWRHERFRKARLKIHELDSLDPVFHQRFPPSELLSMYECMSSAPPLFWAEYKNLKEWQISEATNRKYRERVAPYNIHEHSSFQRIALWLTLATILLATGTAIYGLLTGDPQLAEWFRTLFSRDLEPSG